MGAVSTAWVCVGSYLAGTAETTESPGLGDGHRLQHLNTAGQKHAKRVSNRQAGRLRIEREVVLDWQTKDLLLWGLDGF